MHFFKDSEISSSTGEVMDFSRSKIDEGIASSSISGHEENPSLPGRLGIISDTGRSSKFSSVLIISATTASFSIGSSEQVE